MRIIFILGIFVLIFSGFVMFSKDKEYQPSKGEQLVNSILAKTAEMVKKKYKINPCGVGVAMPGGPIQEVTLCFDTKYPHTKEQLRELLINLSKELLTQVNENNEIQPFLKDLPFTIKNIQIIIYNHDKNGRTIYDPEILTAEISHNVLTYRTIDSQDSFKLKNEFKESYEEALKRIQE